MRKGPGMSLAAVRAALERERDDLLAGSRAAAADRRPVELDQSRIGRLSRMDALQVQAMSKALEIRRQGRVRRIEAALGRIGDGSYGACAECGEPIPAKRLAIDPTLALCIDCAA